MKSNMRVILKLVFFVTVAANLIGCGGGGGGGSGDTTVTTVPTTPTTTVPVVLVDPNMTVPLQKTLGNIVNNGLISLFEVTGWIDNSTAANPQQATPMTGTGTYTQGAANGTTFKGVGALMATRVVTTTINGKITSASDNIYYNSADYTTLAIESVSKTITTAPYSIPATVKVGNTGTLAVIQTANPPYKESYAVATGEANSLLVTIIADHGSDIGGVQTQTVYRVTTTGAISLVSITRTDTFLGYTYKSQTYTFEGHVPPIVLPPVRAATAPTNPTTPVASGTLITQSQIDGEFTGWSGNTIFKLVNVQRWQQSTYDYYYSYLYRPDVSIFLINGSYVMQVQGISNTVKVTRVF